MMFYEFTALLMLKIKIASSWACLYRYDMFLLSVAGKIGMKALGRIKAEKWNLEQSMRGYMDQRVIWSVNLSMKSASRDEKLKSWSTIPYTDHESLYSPWKENVENIEGSCTRNWRKLYETLHGPWRSVRTLKRPVDSDDQVSTEE